MANEKEDLFSANFGIEDTLEMGAGDSQLLKDLIAPDSATGNPDDLDPIDKTIPPDPSPNPGQKKPPAPPKPDDDPEPPDPKKQNIIAEYLGEGDGDDDDDPPGGKKPAEPSDDDPPAPGGDPTQFEALAKDLFKLGVFVQEDEEGEVQIKTPQEFLERFNSEKKKGAIEMVNNFIGQFGEDYQEAFDAIFVKGVNPKEYFGVYNEVADFATLDMKVESNQEMVIRRALTDQGFEEEDIATEIERLKNYGDLETVATKHHKVVVKKQAAKLQEMETRAEQELYQKNLAKSQYVTNVNTVLQDKLKAKSFDGIPINNKLAAELQDFLLVDKYKTKSGETLTDFDRTILELKRPENHEMKVKVALILKTLEKDPTLSTIQNTGVTKKANELFGEVARQHGKNKSPISDGRQNFSWNL